MRDDDRRAPRERVLRSVDDVRTELLGESGVNEFTIVVLAFPVVRQTLFLEQLKQRADERRAVVRIYRCHIAVQHHIGVHF